MHTHAEISQIAAALAKKWIFDVFAYRVLRIWNVLPHDTDFSSLAGLKSCQSLVTYVYGGCRPNCLGRPTTTCSELAIDGQRL